MRAIPVAKDLHRRSLVVQFSHKSSAARPFRPLLACAVFGLTLAGALAAAGAQGANVVGTIAGSAGVSAGGAATYSIPINVPRGSGGLTPQIALVYNSQSGSGMAGIGWTLSGFSAITRCNSAIYDDLQAQAVQFVASDDYCLDGQRLRLTGGIYGTDGSTYDTEIADFSIITAHANSGATNGPSWFTVRNKDGTIYEYGNTTDSKVLAQGTTVVRVWALDKITDVNTNYIGFSYQQDTTDGDYWPIAINYTGNTAAGTTPKHQVQLDWAARSPADTQTGYIAGSLVAQTELLQDIKVNYNGSTTFTYTLAPYSTDPVTSRSLLTSVQECNSIDGNCYPATTIGWQESQKGWGTDTQTTERILNAAYAQAAHLVDVNGDGLADLVYPCLNGDWCVMFGQLGGGFSPHVDTGNPAINYQYTQVLDFNGDGRADFIYPNANIYNPDNLWHVLESTGGTTTGNVFTDIKTSIGVGNYQGDAVIADLNGHGLGDLVYSDGTSIYEAPNTGGSFGASQVLVQGSSTDTNNLGISGVSSFSQFVDSSMDFVGSGRGGRISLVGQTSGTTTNYYWYAYYPTGTSSTLSYVNAGYISAGTNLAGWSFPAPVNLNGDGLNDFFTSYTPSSGGYVVYNLYLSTGTALVNVNGVDGVANQDAVFTDYYGNGRQTMLVDVYNGAAGWNAVSLNYNPAQHAFIPQSTPISAAPYSSGYVQGTIRVGDTGGRGLDDLVYASNDNGTLLWHYRLHVPSTPDLVTSITDGLGNNFSPQYVSLADSGSIYTKGKTATWPVVDKIPSLYVVSSYSYNDGTGGTPSMSYAYTGLQANMNGLSLGFSSRGSTDSRNGVTTTDNYDQNFPYIGMVDSETAIQSNGALISKTTNTPQNTQLGRGNVARYDVTLQLTVNSSYDINNNGMVVKTATTQNKSFDAYGDVTDQTVDVVDSHSFADFKTETATLYADSISPYCISAPLKVTVTKTNPDGTAMQRISDSSTSFDDTHCRPNQITVQAGTDNVPNVVDTSDGLALTTAYGYDQWGNVSQTTVSGTLITAPRISSADYTTANGTTSSGEYPDSLTNALGQKTLESWHSDTGFEISVTDPNGHVTTNTPDGFGRLASVTHPDGSSVNWQYGLCDSTCPATVGSYMITESVHNAGATQTLTPSITQYDSKGRVVNTITRLLGNVTSNATTAYDSLGRVTQVTNPHFGSQDVSQTYYNNYDVLNRVGQILRPVNAGFKPVNSSDASHSVETELTYNTPANAPTGTSGFVVEAQTTDHQSGNPPETTYKESDALGELTAMLDANNGSTQYAYDPFGDLASVKAVDGLSTGMEYDGLGNKIKMVDPDMGTWTYIYDALGELLTQTDAKSQKITQVYDKVGRVSSRTEYNANGTQAVADTWTFDSAANGVGLPASASDSTGYSKSYSYDSLSRPSALDTDISGTDYQVSTTYDSFGRVATVSYPVSVTPATALPVANPKAAPTSLAGGGTVTLDGTGSTDPNGDPLQYAWSVAAQPTGSNVAISNPTAPKPTAVPVQGGSYTFQLVVSDANAVSAPATVGIYVGTPSSPTGVSLSPNPSINGSYTLSWTSPGNGIAVTGFYVHEIANNGPDTVIATVPYTNGTTVYNYGPSVKGNGTYKYYIVAYNGAGPGAASSTVTESVTLPPGAPGTPTISGANPSVTGNYSLSWTAPSGTATFYQVYESSGGAYTQIATVNAPNQTYGVPSRGNGTYWYYIVACNTSTAACGAASAASSVTVLLTPGVPGLSVNSTVISSGGSITLSWNQPSGTVTYYNLSRLDTNTNTTVTRYSGAATSYSESLTQVDYFDYNVQACNSAGCGGWSNTVQVQVTSSGGGGCKTCSKTSPTGGGTTSAPSGGTTSAPASGSGPVGFAQPQDLQPQNLVKPMAQAPLLAAATSQTETVTAVLAKEREALAAHRPAQAPESVIEAEAMRHEQEKSPALLPPAPAADLVAWEQAQAGHDAAGPRYAAPVYLAYGGARIQPATGSTYRFTVQYQYDAVSGALVAVANQADGFVYWQAATGGSAAPVDGFGHLLGYIDGNNVDTILNYDTATGAPIGIGTTGPTGSNFGIQQLTYSWDGFGNLSQRCDVNRGLTEALVYDNLNRLRSSTVNTGASNCTGGTSAPASALAVTYDPIGDITCKGTSCGGTPTYNYQDTNHPRAVTSVSGLPGSYSYDANGNMSSRNGGAITWNVDNLPTQISSSAGTSTFSYGPDRERYFQSATSGSTTTTTTYVAGGLFEMVTSGGTTQYRHSIIAGGQTVAVHTITNTGATTTGYMHSDHLGSSDTITNEQGAVAQSMSFDAFGMRRDSSNWAYDLSSTQIAGLTSITNQGYTAQEQLDNLGLVHMNGRVYDPVLGRMISADPTVPNPRYSQAFNRYAYAYNSPLAYKDPSGFSASTAGPCPQGDGAGNNCAPTPAPPDPPPPPPPAPPAPDVPPSDTPAPLPPPTPPAGQDNNQGSTMQLGTIPVPGSMGNSLGYSSDSNCYTCAATWANAPSTTSSPTSGSNNTLGNYLLKKGSVDISYEYKFVAIDISFNSDGVSATLLYGPGFGQDFNVQASLNFMDEPQGLVGGTIITAGDDFGGSLFVAAGSGGVTTQVGLGYNSGYAVMGVVGYASVSATWNQIGNFVKTAITNGPYPAIATYTGH